MLRKTRISGGKYRQSYTWFSSGFAEPLTVVMSRSSQNIPWTYWLDELSRPMELAEIQEFKSAATT